MKVQRYGVGVEVPRGWDCRIRRRPAESGEATTRSVTHVATVPLTADPGDFGSGVTDLLAGDDVIVTLFEYDPEAARTPLFATKGRPRLKPGDFRPEALQRTLAGQSGAQYFFREGGRAFCLYVVLGDHARRVKLVAEVNAVVRNLVITPVGAP